MEKVNKKRIAVIAAVILVVMVATALVFAGLGIARAVKAANVPEVEYDGGALNVILMIGDGMGFNHVKAAEALYGDLFFDDAPVKGEVTTYSMTLFGPTDSAAAATALATGHKTYNGSVGQYMGKDLMSTTELAHSLGLATGVIATEGVDGATPAGFSAHVSTRSDIDGIFSDQMSSGIDLFMGSNVARYSALTQEITKNYSYFDSYSALDTNADKIFASFEEIPLQNGGDKKPTLAQLAVKAMDRLSRDEDGFFLMIEESHIDKCSHENDLLGALSHVKAYDNAIKAVVEYAQKIGNTIVIVTADHETGGLQYNGETADQLGDLMYTKSSHSEANVPYYIFGQLDYELASTIDNTQIAKLCQALIQGA